jgi:hypothetical protein
MPKQERHKPFVLLGERLKRIRETRRESVAEVSGAVEIDSELLERFEGGEECPSEDILNLLITHFSLHEHEAVQLWEWAGFGHGGDLRNDTMQELASKATIVLVALDSRVLYTDGMVVATDDNGVVLNFIQAGAQIAVTIARLGMSYQQAAQILTTLEQALLRQRYLPKYRLLPPKTSAE